MRDYRRNSTGLGARLEEGEEQAEGAKDASCVLTWEDTDPMNSDREDRNGLGRGKGADTFP